MSHSYSEIDTVAIAEKLKNGEYFREARLWYGATHHAPIVERAYFIVVTIIALVATVVAVYSFISLFPLKPAVPFVIQTQSVTRELPRLTNLMNRNDTPDKALLRFYIRHYVEAREEYDIATLERDFYGVQSMSEPGEFNRYHAIMDPRNPRSPLTLYGRDTVRSVRVLSSELHLDANPPAAQVGFEATLTQGKSVRKTYWVADITFRFTKIAVKEVEYPDAGEPTLNVTPMQFAVSSYNTREKLPDLQ